MTYPTDTPNPYPRTTHPAYEIGERVIATDAKAVARPGTVLKVRLGSRFDLERKAGAGYWYKVDTADVRGDLWWAEEQLTPAPTPPRTVAPLPDDGKWS